MTGSAAAIIATVVGLNALAVVVGLISWLLVRRPPTYLSDVVLGLSLGVAIGVFLLSGWLGRIAGAAAVLYGSLPPH